MVTATETVADRKEVALIGAVQTVAGTAAGPGRSTAVVFVATAVAPALMGAGPGRGPMAGVPPESDRSARRATAPDDRRPHDRSPMVPLPSKPEAGKVHLRSTARVRKDLPALPDRPAARAAAAPGVPCRAVLRAVLGTAL